MKKSLLMLLLALCMVVCFTAITVSAEETEHAHCVCNDAQSMHESDKCEDIPYTLLTQAAFDSATVDGEIVRTSADGKSYYIADGNYYLNANITITKQIRLEGEADVTICLNGHTLASSARAFGVYGTAKLTITDCKYDEETDGTHKYSGTVSSNSASDGSVIYAQDSAIVNICGGNFIGKAENTSATGGTIWVISKSTLNIYDGTITGGKSTNTSAAGGTLCLKWGPVVNMYGGTISGGEAANGGNVAIVENGTFNMYGGTISGGTATTGTGGNIYIAKGTFNLNGGTITEGKANSSTGGNIRVDSGCTLNINGGTISDGEAATHGGNVAIGYSGTVKMTAGTITGGKGKSASGHGGNIAAFGTLTISGGLIEKGYTEGNGGNISGPIGNNANITISGNAVVTAGEAKGYGGNIWYNPGTDAAAIARCNLTIKGGTISDGKAANGGNVYIDNDAITMSGITLSGGTATGDGGNIYVGTGAAFTMTDGNITGGSAVNGGGIYADPAVTADKLNLQGGTIKDNSADSRGNDVYANKGNVTVSGTIVIGHLYCASTQFVVGELTEGASIGLYRTTVAAKDVFANNVANSAAAAYFKVINLEGREVQYDAAAKTLAFVKTAPHKNHCVCGVSGAEHGCVEVEEWIPLTQADFDNATEDTRPVSKYVHTDKSTNYLIASGNYYLDSDVKPAHAIRLKDAVNVTICLNGHTLTRNGQILKAVGGTTLTITDCEYILEIDGNHKYGGQVLSTSETTYAAVLYIDGASTVNLYGGYFVSTKSTSTNGGGTVYMTSSSTLNIYDGRITGGNNSNNTNGGNIYVGAKSIVNMYGGSITAGKAGTGKGGNVAINDGTFNLYGGIIKTGSAANGGNIYVQKGTLNVNGGTISSGYATSNGGNIRVDSGCTLNIKGGTISEGSAPEGGSVCLGYSAKAYMTGGTVTGGESTKTSGSGGGNFLAFGLLEVSGGRIEKGNAAYNGGNISGPIDNNANITISGDAVVTAGVAKGNGGNIWYNPGSTASNCNLTISGGIISDGKAVKGGNVYIENDTVTMSGGTISGGTATGDGGSVYVAASAAFTMSDGTISGGNAANGGNVALGGANASFTMNGGTISGGKTTAKGGNIYIAQGIFTLNNGTISDGKASGTGGNIRVDDGCTLNINGGTISNGEADTHGGNVAIGYSGTVKMTAGTITGGKGKSASGHGGNIAAFGTLTISGGLIEKGYTEGNGGNISGPIGNNANITISDNAVVTAGEAKGNGGNIWYNPGTDAKAIERCNLTIKGGAISDGKAVKGGNIYIENDAITMSGGTISGGTATGNGGSILVGTDATFTMSDGTITEGKSSAAGGNIRIDGTLNINGGTISSGEGTQGGNICVGPAGICNMTSGTVTDGKVLVTNGHGGNIAAFGELNISGGIVSNGESVKEGGNISAFQNNATVTISGGTITGGTAGTNGGNIYINFLNSNKDLSFEITGDALIENGTAKNGGNIALEGKMDNAAVTISGGTISGGNVTTGKGNGIYVISGVLNIMGDAQLSSEGVDLYVNNADETTVAVTFENITDEITVEVAVAENAFGSSEDDCAANFKSADEKYIVVYTDGKLYLKKAYAAVVYQGETEIDQYNTFEEAAKVAEENDKYYIKLLDHTETDYEVTGTLYVDLNGYDLSGIVVSGKLYGMDSVTDKYDAADAGTLSYTGEGEVPVHHKTSVTGKVRRYLTYTEEDGSVSFHRIYLGIKSASLRPSDLSVGYKATFRADEKAQSMLDETEAFGYKLWLDGYESSAAPAYKGRDQFNNTGEVTLRLTNFDVAYSEVLVCAQVYLKLEGDTVIESANYEYTFRQMLELINIDENFSKYTDKQKTALEELSAKYSDTMLSWDIHNIHHAEGSGWTAVTQDELIALLVNRNINYDSSNNPVSRTVLPEGRYVLTGNVDISTKTIAIDEGETVSICLNGYELTGARTMFRNFGTLNICDCHESAGEGNVIGTVDNATYYGAVMYNYYESVTNLYGGNLKATGTLNSGGVLALSHDGKLENAITSKPNAAEFNMHGGTISGGKATANGGNIILWSGATFNLYDGTVTGGTADKAGGCIYASSIDCTVNIYGGTVSGGTAKGGSGGNIYAIGSLKMSGGTVTGGSATGLGEGIFVDTKASANISGDVVITGNGDSNLYKKDYWDVTIENLGANAQIGITASDTYGVIGVIYNNAAAVNQFTSDDGAYKVCAMNGKVLLMKAGFAAEDIESSIDEFSVGYDITDINPTQDMIDVGLAMSNSRSVGGISSRGLNVTTVAITDAKNNTILMVTLDLQGHLTNHQQFRDRIAAATGVDAKNIYLSATHAHNTPDITSSKAANVRYVYMLTDRMIESALNAMADRAPATMQTGSFEPSEDGKFFNYDRHYYYERLESKWHEVETGYYGDNFGSEPEDVSSWFGGYLKENYVRKDGGDHTMHLLAFQRDGEQPILLANWRAHPTRAYETTDIDSDVIGATRNYINGQGYLFAYFQGAAGNMNTTSKLGDTLYSSSIDNYGNALGSQIVAAVSSGLTTVKTGLIQTYQYSYPAIVDHSESTDERLAQAQEVVDAYKANDGTVDTLIKKYNFSSIFHAQRVLKKATLGEYEYIELNVFSIGNSVAFYTAPAELWDSFSEEIEESVRNQFPTTFCIGYSNGFVAYIPYKVTYDSYEGDFCLFNEAVVAPEMMEFYLTQLAAQHSNAVVDE